MKRVLPVLLLLFLVIGSYLAFHYLPGAVLNHLAGRAAQEINLDSLVSDCIDQLESGGAEEMAGVHPEGADGPPAATENKDNPNPPGNSGPGPGAKTPGAAVSPGKTPGPRGGVLLASREDALGLLLSRFSTAEIGAFIAMAQDGLNPSEWKEIVSEVRSRLSPEEYKALEHFVLKEIQSRQISALETGSPAGIREAGRSGQAAGGEYAPGLSREGFEDLEAVVISQLKKKPQP